LAWSDYRTGGPYPYAIYTSSYDGVSWSANVQVNGDTGAHFEANPAVGIDAAGDIVVAWTSWSVVTVFPVPIIQQEILASVRDVVAPTASAGSSATVDQGTAASFDGSGSADNLGIASASWDFGDGSTSMGLTASHSYANPGLYMATLTVWDNSGNAATATRSVTVRDTAAPIPRGGGDRTADEGQSLFFDGSASSDNVAVTSYLWDFGDGSNATSATATHVYPRTGTYTAKLTVRDAAGNPATTQFTVTIRPNGLLTYIEILGGIVGLLLILVGLLTETNALREELLLQLVDVVRREADPRLLADVRDVGVVVRGVVVHLLRRREGHDARLLLREAVVGEALLTRHPVGLQAQRLLEELAGLLRVLRDDGDEGEGRHALAADLRLVRLCEEQHVPVRIREASERPVLPLDLGLDALLLQLRYSAFQVVRQESDARDPADHLEPGFVDVLSPLRRRLPRREGSISTATRRAEGEITPLRHRGPNLEADLLRVKRLRRFQVLHVDFQVCQLKLRHAKPLFSPPYRHGDS